MISISPLLRLSNIYAKNSVQMIYNFVLPTCRPNSRHCLNNTISVDIIGKRHIFPTLDAAIYAYPDSKRSTVEMVQRLKLPAQSYVVIGGGVLEALKLRDTNDVDFVVTKRLYKQYQKKGGKNTFRMTANIYSHTTATR